MTNVERWAWQSPEEVRAGKLPNPALWSNGEHSALILIKNLTDPKVKFGPNWRIVMRLTNGQLVIMRAK